jgi:hypothetical protein
MRRGSALALVALAWLLVAAPPALADVDAGDMQIMARALSFMAKPLAGEVLVGVVYSPDNAQSVRELESVQRLLGNGLRVGSVTLEPVPVRLGEAGGARPGLFFLTAGLGAQAQPVAAASRARRIPCVTTDLTQVRSGVCAIGIQSRPRVEILVNRVAAAAVGTEFSTVFSLMITEL